MACPVVSPQQALRMPEQIALLRALARDFPDNRTGKNCTYRMEDALLGAFSVFYTQSPSFLTHQIAMSETRGMSNAQTLFGMRDIPSCYVFRYLSRRTAFYPTVIRRDLENVFL